VLWSQRHQSGRERKVQDRADHDLAPADLVSQPAIKHRADWRANAGSQQDRPRLPVSKVPVLHDERQNECNQEKIEEIEHVADGRGGKYLPLVDCQFLLLFQ
jgi:hypothetical protein